MVTLFAAQIRLAALRNALADNGFSDEAGADAAAGPAISQIGVGASARPTAAAAAVAAIGWLHFAMRAPWNGWRHRRRRGGCSSWHRRDAAPRGQLSGPARALSVTP